ncbi:MAG TPA: amidophosphoribosyltransferase [Candidatus Binatia bacterium]|nr:amidophosphoribosyltransferase [Candidatus Binatia bacterium]
MCGIVGVLVKRERARTQLGTLVVPMLACMDARGPDSAGLAVFHDATPAGARRMSLFAPDRAYPWCTLADRLGADLDGTATIVAHENLAVATSSLAPTAVRAWIETHAPAVRVLGVGRRMDVYKDVGRAPDIARRFDFARLAGTHCVGHTRMATESAVSPAHAHPFTAGEDFCLVHNGSLSNPHMIRRQLEARGIRFETDNDSEAACRWIAWRLAEGDDVETALGRALRVLDGFFTLLVGTAEGLTLVRDAFACKPAVVAETDDWVAVASEFRALAHLPGIADADIFEPRPERVYTWAVDREP